MIHDDTELDAIEEQARAIFRKAERNTPASLDERIKAMARRSLRESGQQGSTPLLRGSFTLMAAADNDTGGAVVLTDKQSGTELSAWTARGKRQSYLVEIKAIEGHENAIGQYMDHPYSILVDGEIIHSGVIDDDSISEPIELDENRTTPPQWSFEVYAKQDESI